MIYIMLYMVWNVIYDISSIEFGKNKKNPTLSMTSMLKRLLCLFGAFDKEEGARKKRGCPAHTHTGSVAAPEQLANTLPFSSLTPRNTSRIGTGIVYQCP